jgi:hypothetical protein
LLYPTAVAVEHGPPGTSARKAEDFSTLAEKIATADARRYPHIVRLGDDLMSGDGHARFAWAFDVLVDGILAAAPRTPANPRTPTGKDER